MFSVNLSGMNRHPMCKLYIFNFPNMGNYIKSTIVCFIQVFKLSSFLYSVILRGINRGTISFKNIFLSSLLQEAT